MRETTRKLCLRAAQQQTGTSPVTAVAIDIEEAGAQLSSLQAAPFRRPTEGYCASTLTARTPPLKAKQ